jgi:hypothetical protein
VSNWTLTYSLSSPQAGESQAAALSVSRSLADRERERLHRGLACSRYDEPNGARRQFIPVQAVLDVTWADPGRITLRSK